MLLCSRFTALGANAGCAGDRARQQNTGECPAPGRRGRQGALGAAPAPSFLREAQLARCRGPRAASSAAERDACSFGLAGPELRRAPYAALRATAATTAAPAADVAALALALPPSAVSPPAGLSGEAGVMAPPEKGDVKESWEKLLRWSKFMRKQDDSNVLASTDKVVVFGGGSFGTAMGTLLARNKASMDVVLLMRDADVAASINGPRRCNERYLRSYTLPPNVRASTAAAEALQGAQYIVHAVPVQHSAAFLTSVAAHITPAAAIISVSKGLEVGTCQTMEEVIARTLGRKHPMAVLSGPTFAVELMDGRPTATVAASRDAALASAVQQLFASPYLRVNTSSDVVGVEVAGALKNVLAIAAGIVEGLDLGNNAMAALVAQGCSEISWLAAKMGAKPSTLAGPAGVGDIMLTCFVSLSRNRTVGVRLGRGERLDAILGSMREVAEGVATAGAVVELAGRYRVSLPVLTAVARILEGQLTPRAAVYELMSLPQVKEG